jgi:hypothetical protein
MPISEETLELFTSKENTEKDLFWDTIRVLSAFFMVEVRSNEENYIISIK